MMTAPPIFVYSAAAVTAFIAVRELRYHLVRNEFLAVLACLFVAYSVTSAQWVDLELNILFSTAVLALMLMFYSQRLMAGGDAKFFAVASLWIGPYCAIPFLFLLAIAVIGHLVIVKACSRVRAKGAVPVALAPSIGFALIVVLISGGPDPLTRAKIYSEGFRLLHQLVYGLLPFAPHGG
jgi:Flp pilus assembly protein protease CpaA